MAQITVDDVIDAFGGQTALAEFLDVSRQAVWSMKEAGSIPPRHWLKLVKASKSARITHDSLAAIRPRRKRGSR